MQCLIIFLEQLASVYLKKYWVMMENHIIINNKDIVMQSFDELFL